MALYRRFLGLQAESRATLLVGGRANVSYGLHGGGLLWSFEVSERGSETFADPIMTRTTRAKALEKSQMWL